MENPLNTLGCANIGRKSKAQATHYYFDSCAPVHRPWGRLDIQNIRQNSIKESE